MLIRCICCREFGAASLDLVPPDELRLHCIHLVAHLQRIVETHQTKRKVQEDTAAMLNTLLGDKNALNLLHLVNLSIWCYYVPIKVLAEERYRSPVARLLSFLCTSDSGALLRASAVKQVTAQLQFVCRTTVLLEALNRLRKNDE